MGLGRKALAGAALAVLLPGLAGAQATAPRADQLAFRETYKELVEINTTLSVGSCTAAAEAMAKRLKAAGFPDSDLHIIVDPAHPREGNLVAVLPGTDPKAKAILLLAHIDVVEANRADWTRDPFTLIEEDGWFYARGATDDKAQAAIWVGHPGPLQTGGLQAPPHREDGPDLRRGERQRPQRRRAAGDAVSPADRRRLRPQRRRRRPAERRRPARLPVRSITDCP